VSPIEQCWSKIKTFLRKAKASAIEVLLEAIALARSGCAPGTPLRHPGRRVVHGSSGARTLQRSLYRALELIFQINGYLPLFDRVYEIGHGLKMALTQGCKLIQ
jgi:hypothetical protein